eukprot:CAMPEP_0204236448 /NCGR_PEP_ID=MMETSP0361-20130328/92484_1 /ASSEMBLY_ACC=CAM_ASM_000343 /TAXON_ID=268821 /ORGANISM="Scrippsiella Hangoei, Strain SHTV-5" /LENGTH=74 /DNA_ID=CAMNT_0051208439 /DNA_START=71 /DNA_END=291 /DNA_ORIENTATION=-
MSSMMVCGLILGSSVHRLSWPGGGILASHSRASKTNLAAAVAIGVDACRARARGNGSLWQRPICGSWASEWDLL